MSNQGGVGYANGLVKLAGTMHADIGKSAAL